MSRWQNRALRLAGCLTAWLSVVAVGSAQPAAVTYQQILDYLKLEVKEEKILKLLEESPAVFTLSDAQEQKLKSAGASERLLAAMKKRGATVGEAASDIRNFVLILDCSGSMKDQAEGGVTKFEAAQKAAVKLVRSVPDQRRFALVVYGHDLTKRCAAIELLRPLSPLDGDGQEDVAAMIAVLKPSADTPIAGSLSLAMSVLRDASDLSKVILITDGMETCQGDPVSVATELAALPQLRGGVDVIGYGLKREEVAAVERIARAGRGEFYNADSVARLQESVEKVGERIAKSKLNEVGESGLSKLDQLLIKQLGDEDVNVRVKAAKSLGERRIKGAVPALCDLIANERWNYGASVGALGSNNETDGSKDESLKHAVAMDRDAAEQALIRGLNAESSMVAAWAAHQLGALKMKSAAPALAKVIASDRWQIGNNIWGYKVNLQDAQKVIALEVLKKFDREAAEEALLKAADSSENRVRTWATEMLTKLAEEAK